MIRWAIDYYSSPSGGEPVQDFIDSLQEKTKTRVYNSLELLSEFGLILRMPHVKKLTGTSLWELRILGEASLRFFYIAKTGQSFLILHGFTKRKQQTPKKEIETAIRRLKEYQNRP